MSPPCSSVTLQQLEPPSLTSRMTHATLSLWWPLLENIRGRVLLEQCFFHCKVCLNMCIYAFTYVTWKCSLYAIAPGIPAPSEVRAEITADNTSIKVSWQWSPNGVPMCVDLVQVRYQPEGGSEMMYTVSNTTATSATLPNLQCDTEYTIWVYVESGSNKTGNMSVSRMISIPARGMYDCLRNTVTVI